MATTLELTSESVDVQPGQAENVTRYPTNHFKFPDFTVLATIFAITHDWWMNCSEPESVNSCNCESGISEPENLFAVATS